MNKVYVFKQCIFLSVAIVTTIAYTYDWKLVNTDRLRTIIIKNNKGK